MVEAVEPGRLFYYDEKTEKWVRGQDKKGYESDDSNRLVRIPSELRQLQQLEPLSLGQNKILVIEGFEQLAALQQLNLSYNQITTTSGLEQLAALK